MAKLAPHELFLAADAPDLYRSFSVRTFRAPSIAWLNERYWNATTTEFSPEQLENELLSRFAATAPSPYEPEDIFRGAPCLLYADRYGAPKGAIHGGSGRAGTYGRLNAKGVGATPLCNVGADWYHPNLHTASVFAGTEIGYLRSCWRTLTTWEASVSAAHAFSLRIPQRSALSASSFAPQHTP